MCRYIFLTLLLINFIVSASYFFIYIYLFQHQLKHAETSTWNEGFFNNRWIHPTERPSRWSDRHYKSWAKMKQKAKGE